MSKYINADKLIKDLRVNAAEHYNSVVNSIIIAQPSADVVEVVRCEDCKHFVETGGTRGGCFLFQGMTNPRSDDFCSEGERKNR